MAEGVPPEGIGAGGEAGGYEGEGGEREEGEAEAPSLGEVVGVREEEEEDREDEDWPDFLRAYAYECCRFMMGFAPPFALLALVLFLVSEEGDFEEEPRRDFCGEVVEEVEEVEVESGPDAFLEGVVVLSSPFPPEFLFSPSFAPSFEDRLELAFFFFFSASASANNNSSKALWSWSSLGGPINNHFCTDRS